jgi:hypothetical protein
MPPRAEARMIRSELGRLIAKDPFEPFQIKLVNGDAHNVFYPDNVVVEKMIVSIMWPDQNWVVFPLDKIASLESLIADFPGELGTHEPQ